jgi:hypothetical protein
MVEGIWRRQRDVAKSGMSDIRIAEAVTEVERLRGTPPVSTASVTAFTLTPNGTTKGVDVSFSLVNVKGMDSVTLIRASSGDPAQAIVLQTWAATASHFTWSDTDAALQAMGEAYYWLTLKPSNVTSESVQDGPEVIILNPSLTPPPDALDISASHGIAKNGFVNVTVNVSVVPTGTYSVKIYASGYLGVAGFVAVKQGSSSPLQFRMEATGETITLKAIAVSSGGAEAASGPTCSLTLNGTLTVPAKPLQVLVTQIATGNQIVAVESKDEGVTSYQLWRNQSGSGFGTATNIATISPGVGLVQYLDTAGLANLYEYYLVAVNSAGSSAPSDAATAFVIYSSAQVPPNVPSNATNTATIDSIDAGANATIRVYGVAGVGTGYTRLTGYGTPSRPASSITGQPYTSVLYVMWTGSAHIAVSSFASTLPDGWELVGKVTTVAAGGGGGSGGGGGTGGSGGCVELGTAVEQPWGTIEMPLPCSEWVVMDLGSGPVKMHPKTLVSVFKEACELDYQDKVEVKGGLWKNPVLLAPETREGVKISRQCPGGVYLAGPDLARLHNNKALPI